MNCEFCDKNLAKMHCLNCSKSLNLCDECFASNHQSPSRKDHKVECLSSNSSQISLYKLCSKHKEVPCKYFCIDCQLLICSDCMMLDGHMKHKNISNIKKVSKKKF